MKTIYTMLSAGLFGAFLSLAGVSISTKPGFTIVLLLWFCVVNAGAAEKLFEKR